MTRGYTAREVTRMLGLPPSRVRAFVRAGLLAPERGARGEYRFTFQDLVLLRTARRLIEAEVPPRRVHGALQSLRARMRDGRPLAGVHVRADGKRVVVREDGALWRPESGQAVFDFDVGAAAREVASLDDPATRRRRGGTGGAAHDDADAETWYRRGYDLEDESPDEARAAYLRVLALAPAHAEAHVNLGRLLHDAGDLAGAERHYRAGLAAAPDDVVAAFNLGVALEDLGRLDEAVAAYEGALAVDAGCADAHYNLARLHERLGRKAAALRHLSAYRQLTSR
jgi:DNA-binding transcriptional MerR regulator